MLRFQIINNDVNNSDINDLYYKVDVVLLFTFVLYHFNEKYVNKLKFILLIYRTNSSTNVKKQKLYQLCHVTAQ